MTHTRTLVFVRDYLCMWISAFGVVCECARMCFYVYNRQGNRSSSSFFWLLTQSFACLSHKWILLLYFSLLCKTLCLKYALFAAASIFYCCQVIKFNTLALIFIHFVPSFFIHRFGFAVCVWAKRSFTLAWNSILAER